MKVFKNIKCRLCLKPSFLFQDITNPRKNVISVFSSQSFFYCQDLLIDNHFLELFPIKCKKPPIKNNLGP